MKNEVASSTLPSLVGTVICPTAILRADPVRVSSSSVVQTSVDFFKNPVEGVQAYTSRTVPPCVARCADKKVINRRLEDWKRGEAREDESLARTGGKDETTTTPDAR